MLSVIGLVLLAACCHAIWNAYVKVSEDRLAGLVSINLRGALSSGNTNEKHHLLDR